MAEPVEPGPKLFFDFERSTRICQKATQSTTQKTTNSTTDCGCGCGTKGKDDGSKKK